MVQFHAMKIVAAADGGYTPIAGHYLASFDPDAHNGRGEIKTTREIAFALIFHDETDAFEFWKQQPSARPLRPDGKPNRPLTAYSVEFVKVRGA